MGRYSPSRGSLVLAALLLIAVSMILWTAANRRGRPGSHEGSVAGQNRSEERLQPTDRNITITIIYDNNRFDERLRPDWGFSCLIRGLEKTILFDTGASGEILLSNMQVLGIAPEEVQVIVISHIHGDHVGGLLDLLERNTHVEVWLPESFPERLKGKIKAKGARIVEVTAPAKILSQAYTTGEMGAVREQSLIVAAEKGLVVITGCSHPGILNIVSRAKSLLDEEVYLVLGGFHLAGTSAESIGTIASGLKSLGVSRVAPLHCSGDTARQIFREYYDDRCILGGVGLVIRI